MRNAKRSPEDRFWSSLRQQGDCWLRGDSGYYTTFKGERAHRWAYRAMVGEIPEGLVLDHMCSNPPCVNPYHLQPVTIQANVLMTRERGRLRNILMEPGAPVSQGAPEAAYRMLVDYLAGRIRSGDIPEGSCLAMPPLTEFPRLVQRPGWLAARRWLKAYGLAEERSGEYFACKAG